MALSYEMTAEDGVLYVKAAGNDESPEQVKQYGLAIIAEARTRGVSRVLCDERDVTYELSTVDTFYLAAFVTALASDAARVAVVCNPGFISDGQFWETVASNRGLPARMFVDYEIAKAWILEGN